MRPERNPTVDAGAAGPGSTIGNAQLRLRVWRKRPAYGSVPVKEFLHDAPGSRSIDGLAAERDEVLLGLLEPRSQTANA